MCEEVYLTTVSLWICGTYIKLYQDWLKEEQYFEDQISFLNSILKLPNNVEVRLMECNKGAYWDGEMIVFCYEMIDHISDVIFSDPNSEIELVKSAIGLL